MTLQTTRLSLAECTVEDAAFILELMNSEEWLEHIGDRHIYHLETAKQYIEQSLIPMYTNNLGLWKMTLRDNDEAIGMCGLIQRDYLDFPDIGFALLPRFFRQGFTYEAGQAVVEHFDKHFANQPLGGITSNDNVASQRLLEKLGLRYEKQITHNGETSRLYIRPASPNHE